jgi:hypothetical protein
VPDFLQQNKFHMTRDEFVDYKNYHLKMKRNLELKVIREGKKQEVVNQIIRFVGENKRSELRK